MGGKRSDHGADEADTLATAVLFRGLDASERQRVLEVARRREVRAAETIVEQGATDRELFVLLSGRARVMIRLDQGGNLEVGELGPGESFGELACLLGERRAASVIASQPGELLCIGESELTALVQDVRPLGLALSRALARDLADALGERNELQSDVTDERRVVTTTDRATARSYVARRHLSTVRDALRRQRLLLADQPRVYVGELVIDASEPEQWAAVFGRTTDAGEIPYAYHVAPWTALVLQITRDMGIVERNLTHRRTTLTRHPSGEHLRADVSYRVQVRAVHLTPRDDDQLTLTIETQVIDPHGTVMTRTLDTFEVADVDRATVRELRKRRNPTDGGVEAAPSALEGDEASGVRELGLGLAEDLGLSYGRVSGDMSPAHTSRTGARLLGHDRPFLPASCLVNLLVHHLTVHEGRAPDRLDLWFLEPVEPGATVRLRFDATRVELLDAEDRPLVTGRRNTAIHAADETAPMARRREPATPSGIPATGAAPSVATAADASSTIDVRPDDQLRFDPRRMQRLLDGDRHELRRRVRDLLREPAFERVPGRPSDDYRDRVLTWTRWIAAEGLGVLAYPTTAGGDDDPAAAVAVFETLAEHDLNLVVKYGVQFGLFGGAILHLGTARHHERYLAAIGSLEVPGCFALTELGHGSNARDIRTRAVYDQARQKFVITTPDDDARKDYIGNAARHGRLAVVFAQLETDGDEHGVHAFVVPIRDEQGAPMPGVRIQDCGAKIGLNGIDNGRLWFDDVDVPWDALLDRHGQVSIDGRYDSPLTSASARFFTMLATLVQGRISIGLAGLSASRSALTIAVRYGERRRQFGPAGGRETPLLDYLTHQRRLLIPAATTYAFHVALRQLVDDHVAIVRDPISGTQERMQLETLAAGCKALATWHTTATIQACREACGGAGYLAENRLGELKADTEVFTTFEGDNTVLLQLVTKTLLSGYKQQFEDMDVAETVRFLLGQALAAVVPTPSSRRADQEHLRSSAFLLEAFSSREQLQLGQLARRLKRTLDDGSDPHAAFIRHQSRVTAVARSHIERVVVERFTGWVDACDDPGLVPVLTGLRDLYALSRLEADRAWFLEQGVFAAPKARAIVGQVDRLCRELRPHALDLVDSFGIPDELLGAPIGTGG